MRLPMIEKRPGFAAESRRTSRAFSSVAPKCSATSTLLSKGESIIRVCTCIFFERTFMPRCREKEREGQAGPTSVSISSSHLYLFLALSDSHSFESLQKFFKTSRPPPDVRTDSGWYWTAQYGLLRCRMAMITRPFSSPSSAHASSSRCSPSFNEA